MQTFKIKLSAKELPELVRAYGFFIAAWESEDAHEELLLEHAIIFRDRLQRSIRPEAKKYTVKLNTADALAFMQWWDAITIGSDYAAVIILRMIGEIDHCRRNVMQQNLIEK